jgi:hypothetical protein
MYYSYKQHNLTITQIKLTEEDTDNDDIKDSLKVDFTVQSKNLFPFEVINHVGIWQEGDTMASRTHRETSSEVSPLIHYGDNQFYAYFDALTLEQCSHTSDPVLKNPYIYIDVFDTTEHSIGFIDKKVPISQDLLKYANCPDSSNSYAK